MNEIQPQWFQFLVKTATKGDGLLKILTQNFIFSKKIFIDIDIK